MKFLDTSCLSYIHLAASSYYTNLAYPKGTCVLYTINMWYNIIILKLSISLYNMWLCNHDLWQHYVWLSGMVHTGGESS